MTFPWLTLVGLFPIVGSLLAFVLKGRTGKIAGLAVAILTMVLGFGLLATYQLGDFSGFQLAEVVPWIPAFGAFYALGVDGMGLVMVLLTVILVPVVMLAEFYLSDRADAFAPPRQIAADEFVEKQERAWGGNVFFGLVLILEGLSLYVFMATDVLLFYLMFEATLIPMYFLIAGWGGPKRKAAALKFLLYSLAGGLIMLASVVGIYAVGAAKGAPTYLLTTLQTIHFDGNIGRWLMVGFLIAFIIKAPMVPLHTWLPDTTEQATPGTSTLLVGILDKIGTFGMIRYCIGLFPEASKWATPAIIILALVSIIYGGIVAIGQKNLLRLVAFTSISHFGFMVMGIFALTTQSLTGSIFYMVNHGFSTAALFLVVGMLIKRRGSSEVAAFGGVQKVAPILAGLVLVSGLSGLALPGMSSFVSEFMVLAGTWQRYPMYAAIAAFGTVLAALYILLMYQRTMTGPVTEQVATHVKTDLSIGERLVLVPVLVILLVFGFYPKPLLQVIEPTAHATMAQADVTDPEPQAGKGVK